MAIWNLQPGTDPPGGPAPGTPGRAGRIHVAGTCVALPGPHNVPEGHQVPSRLSRWGILTPRPQALRSIHPARHRTPDTVTGHRPCARPPARRALGLSRALEPGRGAAAEEGPEGGCRRPAVGTQVSPSPVPDPALRPVPPDDPPAQPGWACTLLPQRPGHGVPYLL